MVIHCSFAHHQAHQEICCAKVLDSRQTSHSFVISAAADRSNLPLFCPLLIASISYHTLPETFSKFAPQNKPKLSQKRNWIFQPLEFSRAFAASFGEGTSWKTLHDRPQTFVEDVYRDCSAIWINYKISPTSTDLKLPVPEPASTVFGGVGSHYKTTMLGDLAWGKYHLPRKIAEGTFFLIAKYQTEGKSLGSTRNIRLWR